jgi:hypothetical protein
VSGLTFDFRSIVLMMVGVTNRSKEAERAPMREEVMAERWSRKHKNSRDQLPSQNARAGGRAADPNSRKPMLTAEVRDVKVVSSSGEVRASVPSTSAGTWFHFELFVRSCSC